MKTQRFKKLGSFALFFLLPFFSHAGEPLTADRAVAIALEVNPSLRAVFSGLEASRSETVQAGLVENPQIGFGMGFPDSSYRVHASQNVSDFHLASLRRRAADSRWEEDRLRVSHEAVVLAARVKEAFYRLQAAEQLGVLLRSSSRSADTAASISDRQKEAGNVNLLENNGWRLMSERSRVDSARNEAERRAARAELSGLLGRGLEKDFEIAARLPPLPKRDIPLDRLETLARERRLDLAAVRHRSSTLKDDLRLARSRALPGVVLGVETEREEDVTRTGFEIELKIPLFDRGQAEKARVAAEMARNRSETAAREDEAIAEVRSSYARMTEAREVAERLRTRVIPLLEQTSDEALKHYNYMLKGVFDLLQIRREKLAVQKEHVEALRDYWIERSRLEASVGGSFNEGNGGRHD